MNTTGTATEILHGGQVFALARQLGCQPEEILDFSASINPLGVPPAARQAAVASLDQAVHYPELHAAGLVAALAAHHQLEDKVLLAGAGATEFIFLVPRVLQPRRALIVAPAFCEYAVALEQAGVPVDYHQLSPQQDFSLSPRALCRDLTPETELVVLANPANPTGTGYPRTVLLALLDELPEHVTLLVDEAFIDFCPGYSLLEQVGVRPNLLLLRSMTKFYAIPGLRVGYLAGPVELVARMKAQQEPWRLSVPAIAAAMACLDAEQYRQETFSGMSVWRQELADALLALGCRVFPSAANYLLCRLPEAGPDARQVAQWLLPQRLLVRTCCDFKGLGPRDLRVAVRTPADNQRLLSALALLLPREDADE